jgi:phosphoglycolate phosphatase-like HAD superfamily hydrolase
MDGKKVILVIDLDGTLYNGFEYYVRAHMKTIKKLETCGLTIPKELKSFDANYKSYVECVKCIPFYYPTFLAEFKEEIEKHKEEIEKKSFEAWRLIKELKRQYKPREIYVLTANPQAKILIKYLSIRIPSKRIVVIDGRVYMERKKGFLEKVKKKGEVVYVADSEEDEIIARDLRIEFVNVLSLKSRLLY